MKQVEHGVPVWQGQGTSAVLHVTDLVMGLHWSPPEHQGVRSTAPANLDAACLLFDSSGNLVEQVHPDRRSSANGSVMHTGDSRDGASDWDDERVFVFLDAVPEKVHALAFCVVSQSGHALNDVAGASCHVSDRMTEAPFLKLELQGVGARRQVCVAVVQRTDAGWVFSRRAGPESDS